MIQSIDQFLFVYGHCIDQRISLLVCIGLIIERREGEAARLVTGIENMLADIEHILAEFARSDIEPPPGLPALTPAACGRRGRPKVLETLEIEHAALAELRAWLHSRLIEARGEKVFSGEFERLAQAGIVAPPGEPKQRGRGRPAGARTAGALDFWTRFVEDGYKQSGKPITTRKAIAIAQSIVNLRKGTHSTENESNVYRARRRVKPPPE